MLVRQVADEDDIKDMQQVCSSPPASMCMPSRPFIAIWSSAAWDLGWGNGSAGKMRSFLKNTLHLWLRGVGIQHMS